MSYRKTPFDPRQLIRESRIAAGLTQAQVAERADIPRSKLSLYESGFVDLNADEMRAVEKILKKQLKQRESGYPLYTSHLSKILQGKEAAAGAEESEWKGGPSPKLSARQQFLKTPVQKILADGKLAAEWRKLSGMSQYEASRKAKISRTKLSAWENGDIQLLKEEAVRCCEVYAEADRKKTLSDPWVHLDMVTKERDELRDRIAKKDELIAILNKVTALDEELIKILKSGPDDSEEGASQEARINALMEQVAALRADNTALVASNARLRQDNENIRAYYEAGTKAALKHAEAEELREKVTESED
jgi:transcriptional regulator with XRE-family HTH domain